MEVDDLHDQLHNTVDDVCLGIRNDAIAMEVNDAIP